MNYIKYLFAKIRLTFATCKVNIAKGLMNKVIRSSRAKTEEIDNSFENFLKHCKKQEKAAVMLKRTKNKNPNKPFLDIDLGIEHFIVLPDVADKITRHESIVAVTRHRYGDWGEVSGYNWLCNNEGAKDPCGIIRSRYPLFGGGYFSVETDKRAKITKMYLGGVA